jgi:hypothetical protein
LQIVFGGEAPTTSALDLAKQVRRTAWAPVANSVSQPVIHRTSSDAKKITTTTESARGGEFARDLGADPSTRR